MRGSAEVGRAQGGGWGVRWGVHRIRGGPGAPTQAGRSVDGRATLSCCPGADSGVTMPVPRTRPFQAGQGPDVPQNRQTSRSCLLVWQPGHTSATRRSVSRLSQRKDGFQDGHLAKLTRGTRSLMASSVARAASQPVFTPQGHHPAD